MKTAVAYIIYNRPKHTNKSFDILRKKKVKKLYIIADGPKENDAEDKEKCKDVRDIVAQIDWPCEVHTNYADKNLGLKKRISSGLDWVFQQEENAIILEDDCIPNEDFFYFCETLLEKYKLNEKVWVVTGNNFQDGKKRSQESYYFSKYPHIWGWATWKRAWKHYDGEINFYKELIESSEWIKIMPDKVERKYWESILLRVINKEIDTWDYAWNASVWYNGGLTATPSKNLVSNIGFGPEGTHTLDANNEYGNMNTEELGTVIHPNEITQNKIADKYTFENNFAGKDLRYPRKILIKIRSKISKIYRKYS